jgi:hypothetical protein
VFHEVVLSTLRDARNRPPVVVDESLSAGVDLVTNVGRFLRQVVGSKVQFTVEGELYKASARRIARELLALPGGFVPVEAQIRLIYRMCVARRYIERRGERALRLSDAGLAFERGNLADKVRALLAFAVEERTQPGEHFHQSRLRRILLRFLKRAEPDVWHDALALAHLARNTYLTRLDEYRVADYFAARFKGGGYVPTESAQQICWHLLDFVKRRLFPLGMVDLGLRDGRPVALRITRLGVELLGAEPAALIGGHRSASVVNPDFEVILFPGEDEHEAVHALDRFATRVKSDNVHHFRLDRESVRAALADGMTLAEICQELADRSRVPLPQNVLYSLEDWAEQAGVLSLDCDRVLHCRRAEQLDKFLALARIRPFVHERRSPNSVALAGGGRLDELEQVARAHGFLIERRDLRR